MSQTKTEWIQEFIDRHKLIKFMRKYPAATRIADIPQRKVPDAIWEKYNHEWFWAYRDNCHWPDPNYRADQAAENFTVGKLMDMQTAMSIANQDADKAWEKKEQEERRKQATAYFDAQPITKTWKKNLTNLKNQLSDLMPDFDLDVLTNGEAKSINKQYRSIAKRERRQQQTSQKPKYGGILRAGMH